jgi:hypothetical protein
MNICGQDFSEKIIEQIKKVVDAQANISRRALSRMVCGWLNWRSRNGKLKEMSCRVALKLLAAQGLILLPEIKNRFFQSHRQHELITITGVECRLEELGMVEIEKVTSLHKNTSRLWRDMMDTYHYLGSGHLCGSQIRD